MNSIKLIIIGFVVSFIFSCSPSPIELAIIDYVEISENTRTDLKTKIIKLENIGTLDTIHDYLKTVKEFVFVYKNKATGELKDYTTRELENVNYDEWEYVDRKEIIIRNGISIDSGKVINKWACVYSINNPLLNNVTQEITKVFLITPENKVVGTIKSE